MTTVFQKVLGALAVVTLVFTATGCLNNSPNQSGVFVTKDGGDSWNSNPDLTAKGAKKPKVYPPLEVTAVGVSAKNAGEIVAGTRDNLYLSTDGGGTWTLLTDKLPTAKKAMAVQGVVFHPSQADTFYVYGVSAGYGKIFKSTDKGQTLRDVFTVAKQGQSVTAMALDPVVTDTLYAGDQLGSVYKSTDSGSSWRRVFSGNQPVSSLVKTTDPLFVGTGGGGVLRSLDGGVSFTPVNNGLANQQLIVWSLHAGLGGIYAGTETGLFFSRDNGNSWQSVGNPLPAKGSRVQALTTSGPSVYYASDAVVYRMSATGTNFVPVQLKLAKAVSILASTPASPNTLYAGAGDVSLNFSQRYSIGLPGALYQPLNVSQ